MKTEASLNQPEIYYKGLNVCVIGKVIDYKGKPEIVVSDPLLLKLKLTDNPVFKPAKLQKHQEANNILRINSLSSSVPSRFTNCLNSAIFE